MPRTLPGLTRGFRDWLLAEIEARRRDDSVLLAHRLPRVDLVVACALCPEVGNGDAPLCIRHASREGDRGGRVDDDRDAAVTAVVVTAGDDVVGRARALAGA